MLDAAPTHFSWLLLALLTLLATVTRLSRGRLQVMPGLFCLWTFFLLLAVADWLSFRVAVWLFAAFSFLALREFFSLVDIRLQDRWGLLGAYFSILFMTYFIHTDWYGMFIISIPVYTFLLIPLLISLGGGEMRGAVFSIGVIDLGLFLFAFCMGHIAYLTFFSVRMAMLLILSVTYCDLICRLHSERRSFAGYLVATATTVVFATLLSSWTGIPRVHSIVLGILIPFLVYCGNFTWRPLEEDLGISSERLEPGRGGLLHSLKAYLFSAPVVFHYLRWFLHWGDL